MDKSTIIKLTHNTPQAQFSQKKQTNPLTNEQLRKKKKLKLLKFSTTYSNNKMALIFKVKTYFILYLFLSSHATHNDTYGKYSPRYE